MFGSAASLPPMVSRPTSAFFSVGKSSLLVTTRYCVDTSDTGVQPVALFHWSRSSAADPPCPGTKAINGIIEKPARVDWENVARVVIGVYREDARL